MSKFNLFWLFLTTICIIISHSLLFVLLFAMELKTMNQSILEKVNAASQKKVIPAFRVGDEVIVSIKIKEGEKERIQNFEGIVISFQGKKTLGANFTVRKISSGIGVERVFPLHSPLVEKVKVKRRGKVRRAKLYYLRGLSSKNARIKKDERTELKSTKETSLEESPKSAEVSPSVSKPEKKKKTA